MTSSCCACAGNEHMRMVFYIDGMGGQNLGPNSGAHLLESNPSPIYHTMTLSTHVYLKKDAVVGIGFERTGDNSNSDWYVHTDTSFSAIRLGPKGHVGFHAGGTTNRDVAAGWHTGSDYSTDESQMGEYQFDSGHFDGVKFTAPVDGIYSVEAQQRHVTIYIYTLSLFLVTSYGGAPHQCPLESRSDASLQCMLMCTCAILITPATHCIP